MNLAGTNTLDTLSTIGVCTYPAKALTGAPKMSQNIIVDDAPLAIYHEGSVPSTVTGYGAPGCENPVVRTMKVVNNSKVYFNQKLPALSEGSSTILGGIERPLTGPFIGAKIKIGTQL